VRPYPASIDAADRPFADLDGAARKLVEIASGIEPVQDGRILTELVNAPFLYRQKSMARSFAPASNLLLSAAGWNCMRAEASCGSPRRARTCSHNVRIVRFPGSSVGRRRR
jgi:hypothetical protein